MWALHGYYSPRDSQVSISRVIANWLFRQFAMDENAVFRELSLSLGYAFSVSARNMPPWKTGCQPGE